MHLHVQIKMKGLQDCLPCMQIVARKLEGHWARTEHLLTWTWNCHCGQSLFASLFYFLSSFISVFLSFLIVISFVSFCHLAVVLFCLFIYFLSVMAVISPVFCLLQYRTDRLKENAKLPCIVCKKWVGNNSSQLVHKLQEMGSWLMQRCEGKFV